MSPIGLFAHSFCNCNLYPSTQLRKPCHDFYFLTIYTKLLPAFSKCDGTEQDEHTQLLV